MALEIYSLVTKLSDAQANVLSFTEQVEALALPHLRQYALGKAAGHIESRGEDLSFLNHLESVAGETLEEQYDTLLSAHHYKLSYYDKNSLTFSVLMNGWEVEQSRLSVPLSWLAEVIADSIAG